MSAEPSSPQGASQSKVQVFAISPLLLLPSAKGQFAVYLKQDGRLVLYATRGEAFTEAHRARLSDLGVRRVYVRSEERSGFTSYIQDNLAALLADDSIPVGERAQTWYDVTLDMARGVFSERLPQGLLRARMQQMQELVRGSVKFIVGTGNLRHIASLVGKGYGVWDHCLASMVFTACVMQTSNPERQRLERVCIGALLHDIGKVRLPAALLAKSEDELSERDRALLRTHPALGAGVCAALPLERESINCILFHHEREKGGGFPSGLSGEDIPDYVKILSVCNAYDTLTRTSRNKPGLSPFEALTILNTSSDAYSSDAVRKLVLTLSTARIA